MTHWAVKLPWTEIEESSKAFLIDPRLVAAIIWEESKGIDKSARYEANYPYYCKVKEMALAHRISQDTEKALQRISWGAMHVMGATARSEGFQGWLPDLCDADLGVRYGCSYLKTLRKTFPELRDLISAYNGGFKTKLKDGKHTNEDYVERVIGYFNELKTFKLRE